MNPPIVGSMHWLLFAVAFLGSAAAYTAISRMFAPPPETDENDLSKLAKKEVGTSSAFSGLSPNGGLVARLALILLKTFHLDVKLEELHMMLGRPQKPTPLDILHLKEFFAAGAIALIYFGTSDPFFAMFGLIGFFIPDSMFNGTVRARQAD